MFRAVLCSSSGVQIACIQHMVSSVCMRGRGGRTVHRLRQKLEHVLRRFLSIVIDSVIQDLPYNTEILWLSCHNLHK
jgi:hypothetical protein